MASEQPEGFEKAQEKFPSVEEIKVQLEMLVQGRAYKELQILTDAEGVYKYEIEVVQENGEKTVYIFQKANYDYKNAKAPGARFSASIHTVTYDFNGTPTGGKCVANYLDGKWSYE